MYSEWINFIWGRRVLLCVTIIWLVAHVLHHAELATRPVDLFMPFTWLGKLVMPVLPPLWIYAGVGLAGILIAALLLCQLVQAPYFIVLAFIVAYCNLAQWSYGFLSHVAHHLVLALLLGCFIGHEGLNNEDTFKNKLHALRWYYAGLLITFSLSAAWKARDVLLKNFGGTSGISWLHPKAAVNTIIASFHAYDQPLSTAASLVLPYPFILQFGFAIETVLQLALPLAAFQHRFRSFALAYLLFFFIANCLLFNVTFITAPVVFLALLFPYAWFFNLFTAAEPLSPGYHPPGDARPSTP